MRHDRKRQTLAHFALASFWYCSAVSCSHNAPGRAGMHNSTACRSSVFSFVDVRAISSLSLCSLPKQRIRPTGVLQSASRKLQTQWSARKKKLILDLPCSCTAVAHLECPTFCAFGRVSVSQLFLSSSSRICLIYKHLKWLGREDSNLRPLLPNSNYTI